MSKTKADLIDEVYMICDRNLEEATPKYSINERDLWIEMVAEAKADNESWFTVLVSGTSQTEAEYIQVVLTKHDTLSTYRLQCINARNKHKEIINSLEDGYECNKYMRRLKEDFWPSL